MLLRSLLAQQTTAIRRIAVRETFMCAQLRTPPETPRTSQHYRIEGIKEVPDMATIGNGNIVFSVHCVA